MAVFTRQRIKTLCVYLFIAAVFIWIGKRIVTDLHRVEWDTAAIQPMLILAACTVLLLAYLIRSVIWVLLFRASGNRIAVLSGMKLFLLTQAGRYIPGKIWQFVGAGVLAQTYNVPAASCVSTTFIAVLLNQGVGILVSFIFFSQFFSQYTYVMVIAICLTVACLAFMSSTYFPRLLDTASRVIKRPLPKIPVPRFHVLCLYACLYAVIWGLFGFGFMLLAQGIVPGGGQLGFLQATGALAAACVVGFLSLFSPSGLGVREMILTLLLSPVVGEAPAGILAIAARIWMTLIEIIVISWAALPVLFRNQVKT
jgi:hypothetical protein